MNTFNLVESPLVGRNLIEASAGTGKTYTIACIYIRLLLEKGFKVEQILVVTFTVAAMEELRSRIRDKIRDTLNAFENECSQDDFISGILKKIKDNREAKILLKRALTSFDEAGIYTIHGFCQRILQDSAFECGTSLKTNLIVDQKALLEDTVFDFWRINIYPASPLFISYIKSNNLGPLTLVNFVKQNMNKYNTRIVPKIEGFEYNFEKSGFQETVCFEAFDKARLMWEKERDAISSFLLNDNGLNRNRYRTKSIKEWILKLDNYFARRRLFPILDKLNKFCTSSILTGMKKGHNPPSYSFFDLCEQLWYALMILCELFDKMILAFRVELLNFCRDELSKRKKDENIRSFDDLLSGFHAALFKKSGKNDLAKIVRKRYQAALIDEFQDTDNLQYEIFNIIYPYKESLIFLIGDPKQAIYSFRGADIFSYMKASSDAKVKYTLTTNWRSMPNLISAVNNIFQNRENPFVFDKIPFNAAKASKRANNDNKVSQISDSPIPNSAPFQIWLWKNDDPGKFMNKREAEDEISKAIACEIVNLLNNNENGHLICSDSPVSSEDIAVLCRTNRQARQVQEALQHKGVPSVLYSSESLFESDEACEVYRLLIALCEPSDETKIKAAMCTDILGVSGNELANIMDNEIMWEEWLLKFKDYHDLWIQKGFISMARAFTARENVRSRLLANRNGERQLTNFLHCIEVLHNAYLENNLGPDGLIKWFASQINEHSDMEEYQIRLETDDSAVKLITIHQSKGLEYPIVFCPFCWGSSNEKDNTKIFYHDPLNNLQATLDLGSSDFDKHKSLAEREILAENLRLLYVAITRAKYRCYLVWGRFRGSDTSALSYLLHFKGDSKSDNLLLDMTQNFSVLDNNSIHDELNLIIAREAGGNIDISYPNIMDNKSFKKIKSDDIDLFCRTFNGKIMSDWRIASFSSLVASKVDDTAIQAKDDEGRAIQAKDNQIYYIDDNGTNLGDDETYIIDKDLNIGKAIDKEIDFEKAPNKPKASDNVKDNLTIFDFPKGAKPGNCLHEIFEKIDYENKSPDLIENQVTEILINYNFDTVYITSICTMVKNVLNIPLFFDNPMVFDKNDQTLSLSLISKTNRINEMEFYFPIEQITSGRLSEIFKRFCKIKTNEEVGEIIKKLSFKPTRGLIKGYIDLVFTFNGKFYIVDWKSNYLGSNITDYNHDAIEEVMGKNFYFFQYYLYTYALHKYLARRISDYNYKTHFGGIFYIFLRGIDPDMGSEFGIYRDLPPESLIDALSDYFSNSSIK